MIDATLDTEGRQARQRAEAVARRLAECSETTSGGRDSTYAVLVVRDSGGARRLVVTANDADNAARDLPAAIRTCCGQTCPPPSDYARPVLGASPGGNDARCYPSRFDVRYHEHHAEQRGILWACQQGLKVETIIPTRQPCHLCRSAVAGDWGDPGLDSFVPLPSWGRGWRDAP